jgi:alcohol dehydrogenase class IV
MSEQVGVIETLGDLGVKKSDLPRLAATAIRDPCLATNPRKATAGDLEKIYEQAL